MILQPRGMGMYPGTPAEAPCFDPNRPSWLPYDLDTWAEGVCFYERLLGKKTQLNFTSGGINVPPSQPAPETALTDPNSGHLDTDAEKAYRDAWMNWSPTAINDEGAKQPSLLIPLLLLGGLVFVVGKSVGRR